MGPIGPQGAVTDALVAWRAGDATAMDRLIPMVYAELARMAHAHLGREAPGHTLSTTALVHEAFLRLVDQTRVQWVSRAQFFAVAAQAMRRVLVDHARRHRAVRRGGAKRQRLSLDQMSREGLEALTAGERAAIVLSLNDALDGLAQLDGRQAKVVELRFFGGLSIEEVAETLGVTSRTVERDWVKARAWLYRELHDAAD